MCHNLGECRIQPSRCPQTHSLAWDDGHWVVSGSRDSTILDIGDATVQMDDAIPPGCDFRDDDKKGRLFNYYVTEDKKSQLMLN